MAIRSSARWSAALLALIVATSKVPGQQYAPVIQVAAETQIAPVLHASSDFRLESTWPHQARISKTSSLDKSEVRLIGEVPWGTDIVQAQFAAGAEQPVDPGTANVGLRSRPSRDSFRSDLRRVLAGSTAPPSAAVAPPTATPDEPAPSPAQLAPEVAVAASTPATSETAIAAADRAIPPSLLATPAVEVVATPEIQILGASETAQILQESTSIQTVESQRRSPIDFDPRIRGYRSGQVYTQADGALWFPARQDLDSILSKLDPSLIQDAIVVPGPYGLRYGPGFGFVNIITSPTPRYDCPETHFRTGMTTRANGGQLYGRQSAFGGGDNWGFIFNYGNRTGSDYESGDNRLIPSSYHAQNFLGQLGYDTSEYTHWEFRYQRLDQTDTEYAGQFFDLNFLVTDGFNASYINEDPTKAWDRLTVDGWYNRTRFDGDTLNQSKRTFNVINRVESALGLPSDGMPPSLVGRTNGALQSIGTRVETLFGVDGHEQLRLGADFRSLRQGISEDFAIINNDPFDTNLPRSTADAPGMYSEVTLPFDEYFWTTTAGARIDWWQTNALAEDIRDNTSLPNIDTDSSPDGCLVCFLSRQRREAERKLGRAIRLRPRAARPYLN